MILGFKTQINGKPTYFIEKIWSCLLQIDFDLYDDYLHPDGFPPQMPWPPSSYKSFIPKLHTFREDKKDKWKPLMIIDFFINVRTKLMFRFAPQIPVVSIQKIEMIWTGKATPIPTIDIWIDGACYVQNYEPDYNSSNQRQTRMEELAHNDGFDTVEDFLAYFNTDFKGKIIHWTDKKY